MTARVEAIDPDQASRLYEQDQTHWLHPQGDLNATPGSMPKLLFASGDGTTLTDIEGRTYIDGLASLWNVNVGHGRRELAEVAAEQMGRLAFSSAYGGFGHAPGAELAARLAELAPGDLDATFFASGGAEANDTAYKLARFYWHLRGEPSRINIVSRIRDYHGLTWAATSATGLAMFRKDFGPLAPGFLHGPSPDPYRFEPGPDGRSAGEVYATALEAVILEAGPETVAAVVAEPVQGAGGVIIPPDDYFPRVRRMCDQHGILLIADEVITGFGRTGRWFGLEHWQVQPDLMIFAKGVTSGYLPLSGVMFTRQIFDVLKTYKGVLPHGFTYSGHPTACAVALRNLEIIERENLVERSAEMGIVLGKRLAGLRKHAIVGDARNLGLIGALELVQDRATKTSYEPSLGVGGRVMRAALADGLIVRALGGDIVALSPPLVITEPEIDRAAEILDRALERTARELEQSS
jgi:putrescine aminotransferase